MIGTSRRSTQHNLEFPKKPPDLVRPDHHASKVVDVVLEMMDRRLPGALLEPSLTLLDRPKSPSSFPSPFRPPLAAPILSSPPFPLSLALALALPLVHGRFYIPFSHSLLLHVLLPPIYPVFFIIGFPPVTRSVYCVFVWDPPIFFFSFLSFFPTSLSSPDFDRLVYWSRFFSFFIRSNQFVYNPFVPTLTFIWSALDVVVESHRNARQ